MTLTSSTTVGKPDENRYTWIKGDATFESLRQACLEPRERVIVAEQPPKGALDYRVIDSVTVSGADWVATPEIPLAPGLVAIIGARGSGKTALADLIAAGAGAASTDEPIRRSCSGLDITSPEATLPWPGATGALRSLTFRRILLR